MAPSMFEQMGADLIRRAEAAKVSLPEFREGVYCNSLLDRMFVVACANSYCPVKPATRNCLTKE